MPPAVAPEPTPRLSRRAVLTVLGTLGGVVVGGCTRGSQQPTERPPEPPADPDVAVAAEALAQQRAMLDLLAATRARHRTLTDQLAAAVATHEAHAAVLAKAVPDGVTPSPATSGSPSPGRPVPRRRSDAVAAVVEAEQALVTAMKRHAFQADSGAFARVLGSMAGAAAQHAVVLGRSPGPRSRR